MKITENVIRESYSVACQVYDGGIALEEGMAKLSDSLGVKPGTASAYITNLDHMLHGREYRRTLNFAATKYYLQRIRVDYADKYENALTALEKHLNYYDTLGKGHQRQIRELLTRKKTELVSPVLNLALRDREVLSETQYIRKAKPNTDYWVGFDESVISKYRDRYGDDFNLVIAGNKNHAGDFFAFPYAAVREMLTDETITVHDGNRRRWIGSVVNGELHISRCPLRLNMAEYYGNEQLLLGGQTMVDEQVNDFAIENRRVEIKQRVKQSVFRARVLENFDGQCCLTGISESELLVSSHIVPWSHRIESRLDPANGLCLAAIYDPLFDRGYISFTDNLQVVLSPLISTLSEPLKTVLEQISGIRAREPSKTPISIEYLNYHRENILKS